MKQLQQAYPSDGTYVVIRRPLKADGVELRVGQYLPPNSKVRVIPRRLGALCSQFKLELTSPSSQPATATVVAATEQKTASALVEETEEVVEVDVGTLSYKELRVACKENNLSSKGKAEVLRTRLVRYFDR